MTGNVFQMNPDDIFMGLIGPDATPGRLYIAEGDNMRPMTPAEVNLALLTLPWLRDALKEINNG